jgi:voltage-gated sodium channel
MTSVRTLIKSARFDRAITVLIAVNAVSLGLETSPYVVAHVGGLLTTIDRLALGCSPPSC